MAQQQQTGSGTNPQNASNRGLSGMDESKRSDEKLNEKGVRSINEKAPNNPSTPREFNADTEDNLGNERGTRQAQGGTRGSVDTGFDKELNADDSELDSEVDSDKKAPRRQAAN